MRVTKFECLCVNIFKLHITREHGPVIQIYKMLQVCIHPVCVFLCVCVWKCKRPLNPGQAFSPSTLFIWIFPTIAKRSDKMRQREHALSSGLLAYLYILPSNSCYYAGFPASPLSHPPRRFLLFSMPRALYPLVFHPSLTHNCRCWLLVAAIDSLKSKI